MTKSSPSKIGLDKYQGMVYHYCVNAVSLISFDCNTPDPRRSFPKGCGVHTPRRGGLYML